MVKKYFMIITIFCLVILVSMPVVVKAQEENTYEREMAIACALSYVPIRAGKNYTGCNYVAVVNEVVNTINAKINIHDYASIDELKDWYVADFHNKEISEKSLAAFTLEKGNDVMILFRGTDMEAFADVMWGIKNYHNQEEYANNYVDEKLKEYAGKGGNFNIYVAGHSLGGYLAQTAGARIEQTIGNYPNLTLKKIVTFNGIGINFFTYFGEKMNYGNQEATIASLKRLGEDGRLIEYYTYGDLVSGLGVHYGEMRQLLPSIDSVEYHRTNYKLLGSISQKIRFSNTLYELTKRDSLNVFKTEVHAAKDLYKIDSLVAFLNLTHESDAFASIENEKSIKNVELKTVESTGVLSEYLKKDKDTFEIKKSITVRAVTSYASAKKYVWEVSTDKENWQKVKVSTVDANDPDYNEDVAPTNTLYIDINGFNDGETKYYRVTAYYDDNYVSSHYEYNSDKGIKGEYEYVVDEDKSRNEEPETIQKIIEVKKYTPKLKNAFSAIKTIFKKIGR